MQCGSACCHVVGAVEALSYTFFLFHNNIDAAK